MQVGNILISSDLITQCFCCDLDACKGACCIEGDVWNDLSTQAQAVIDKQGVACNDREGDLVTSIVNGKDCVFTCYDKGLCLCTFDRAHRAGRCSFRKPISCALYPIREKRFDDDLVGLNYHRCEVCKPAVK